MGLAYRILGSLADAEDVVSEVWFRWNRTDRDRIDRPAAWLTTVTTRVRTRPPAGPQPAGGGLPRAVAPRALVRAAGPEEAAELADSLTLGFLILLDELGPVERAVFVLADVFAVPYDDIAEVVGKSPAACRQIATRARRRVREADLPHGSAADRQRRRRTARRRGHRGTSRGCSTGWPPTWSAPPTAVPAGGRPADPSPPHLEWRAS